MVKHNKALICGNTDKQPICMLIRKRVRIGPDNVISSRSRNCTKTVSVKVVVNVCRCVLVTGSENDTVPLS